MAGQATLIGSAVVSGLGLLVAGGYVAARRIAERRSARGLYAPQTLTAWRRRRTTAAVLIAVISLAFFVGVNFLQPGSYPLVYVCYWAAVMGLLLWLCVLAVLDIGEARRERRRRLSEAARRVAQTLSELQRGGD